MMTGIYLTAAHYQSKAEKHYYKKILFVILLVYSFLPAPLTMA